MKVVLNKKERKLIKKVVKMQLEAINGILNDDYSVDTEIECINENIDKVDLLNVAMQRKLRFEDVDNYPEYFLTMDVADFSIFKHILFNFFGHSKYNHQRNSLWRKIEIMDNFLFTYN